MALVNALLVRYGGGWTEIRARLINPNTGRPAYTGPNGEPGAAVMTGSLTTEWTMPDGITAWYQTGATPDPGNVAALAGYSITVHGRCEAMLQLGAVNDVATARALCQQMFALEAEPLVATSAILETGPLGTDVPYEAYDLGDTITAPDPTGAATAQRVVAITVTEDENGALTFTPAFNSLLFEQDQRIQNLLKSMSNGTVGGTVVSAQPAPISATPAPPSPGPKTVGPAAPNEMPPWSMSGGLVAKVWGRYKVPYAGSLAYINVELDTDPSAAVTFQARLNGSILTASVVTVGTGAQEAQVQFVTTFQAGDVFEMECANPGAGAAEATVQLGYT